MILYMSIHEEYLLEYLVLFESLGIPTSVVDGNNCLGFDVINIYNPNTKIVEFYFLEDNKEYQLLKNSPYFLSEHKLIDSYIMPSLYKPKMYIGDCLMLKFKWPEQSC